MRELVQDLSGCSEELSGLGFILQENVNEELSW